MKNYRLSGALVVLFILAHIVLVAPFVPFANIIPAAFGAVSMTSMALALILAARWRLVDRILGGPDKSYVIHRWLGFLALSGGLVHWATASSYGNGTIPLLAESGEDIGNLAIYGLIILTIVAMVRVVPYHVWKASHMIMGPIFLVAAYHTFFVASPLAVGQVPWWTMATISVIGFVAWAQTLLRKTAITRLVSVSPVEPFEGGVDVTFSSDDDLPRFRAGQFGTIARNRARAEAHPFTIAGGDERHRRFLIRSAGDWTEEFVKTVKVGDKFRLGAGAGRFLPKTSDSRPEQLWIAGGVGITPFLAALERMEPDQGKKVTLIYCMRSRESAGAVSDVERYAQTLPQLDLMIMADRASDGLTQERLAQIISKMDRNAEVYLCGPEGLKDMVSTAWNADGRSGRIHGERFDFRGAMGLTDLIYIGRPIVESAMKFVKS